MIKFMAGIVFGIILATVGMQGVINIFQKSAITVDNSVDKIKTIAKENVK